MSNDPHDTSAHPASIRTDRPKSREDPTCWVCGRPATHRSTNPPHGAVCEDHTRDIDEQPIGALTETEGWYPPTRRTGEKTAALETAEPPTGDMEIRPAFEADLARLQRAATAETVEVVEPQFEREDGVEVQLPPENAGPDWFDALREQPTDTLIELGMRRFEGHLWLFPGEWYDHIPEGYRVTPITGGAEAFEHGKTDDDIRFGCLAYGVVVSDREYESDDDEADAE